MTKENIERGMYQLAITMNSEELAALKLGMLDAMREWQLNAQNRSARWYARRGTTPKREQQIYDACLKTYNAIKVLLNS